LSKILKDQSALPKSLLNPVAVLLKLTRWGSSSVLFFDDDDKTPVLITSNVNKMVLFMMVNIYIIILLD
jgi:hypothetical protein